MSKRIDKTRKAILVEGEPRRDWSDLPAWMTRLNAIYFGDADGRFSKAELDEFLGQLASYVDETQGGDRGGDTLRVLLSIEQVKHAFTTEDDAEIVRRGIRLGLHLSAFDRDIYYLSVQAQHRKKGWTTKQHNLEQRNGQIRDKYQHLKKSLGDLGARQRLRDEHGISLETITKIVTSSSRI